MYLSPEQAQKVINTAMHAGNPWARIVKSGPRFLVKIMYPGDKLGHLERNFYSLHSARRFMFRELQTAEVKWVSLFDTQNKVTLYSWPKKGENND